ncbi:hypothetical protein RYA05_05470 [Pseudomonas syringae pv. actinidiae]|nr:hypothetical protein [Pseudomonas syringae pv. actinidiae]
MTFHRLGMDDSIDQLLSKSSHMAFFMSIEGVLSKKFKVIRWSKRIQKVVAVGLHRVNEPLPNQDGLVEVDVCSVGGTPTNAENVVEPTKSKVVIRKFKDDSNYRVEGVPFHEVTERIAYRPVNINNNYHKGFLYYPVQIVRRDSELRNDKRILIESLESVVVRSDRVVLTIVESAHPGGVGGRIVRLSDGTLIQRRPSSNGHSSWEWDSIQEFLSGQSEPKDISSLLDLIHCHLRSRVWLPEDSDYWMLAVAVVVTYTQAIFDSVPLFLLTGPAGSGKSELSGAMAEVSANSVMIGQTSAPTMMRLIDESGGLVVIDDLESVGVTSKPGGKTENISDIAQALKVSYKKSSATRLVTNTRTMQTEILNFYGVKIISNTKAVDSVLGSRMLHIYTRHMPDAEISGLKMRPKPDPAALRTIRNDLHIWAFENVGVIRDTYLSMYADKTNRDDEIAAPLRVIANISGRRDIDDCIERALALQLTRKGAPETPEDLLLEAAEVLVISGYRSFTITHLMLEMRKLADINFGKVHEGEIPSWNTPEWIGRNLRVMGIIDIKKATLRKRVKGSNLRVVFFSVDYIQSVLKKTGRSFVGVRGPESFCAECNTCQYVKTGCEIKLAHLVG